MPGHASFVGNFDVQIKNQLDSSFINTIHYRILQSDWSRTFWAITPEQGFCEI